ncbi:MAG: RHS repeat-associated core domain-containing protein [Chloroflexota bacterium]
MQINTLSSNTPTVTNKNEYKYNGKMFQDENALNWYDYGARFYDAAVGRWWSMDSHAESYLNISPYSFDANNPLMYVDSDGRDIKVSSEVVDGKTVITVTVTGKLINESSNTYTQEQMKAYADRLVSSISSTYTGSDGDVSWKGVANISIASDENQLKDTDHAFRIVDQGKIPRWEGQNDVLGLAPFGENVVYLSNHILDRTPAASGTYEGTGKTDTGGGTLERTGSHELGHSGKLKHPTSGTMDGNIMHQTKQPNAGVKVTKDQIFKIKKYYDDGELNQGKQKIE